MINRALFLAIFAIVALFAAVPAEGRHASATEQFNEICLVPEQYNEDGKPMVLAYHYYAKRMLFITFAVGEDDTWLQTKYPGLVVYRADSDGTVDEYYDVEELLAENEEFRNDILTAAGVSSVDELKRETTYDYWSRRIFWGIVVLFIAGTLLYGAKVTITSKLKGSQKRN